MSKVFFDFFKIKGKIYNINPDRKSQVTFFSDSVRRIEKILKINRPNFLIVQGDTNTGLAGCMAASLVNRNLDYKNKIIGKQKNIIDFQNDKLEDVFNSRTFCLYEDIENIKKMGLAKGGSLENAIVVDGEKILNKDGLSNEKEFVNHKILDLAGDFLLSGSRILGSVNCTQGGHNLSNVFLRNLLKDKTNYSIIELTESKSIKTYFKTPANKLAVNA